MFTLLHRDLDLLKMVQVDVARIWTSLTASLQGYASTEAASFVPSDKTLVKSRIYPMRGEIFEFRRARCINICGEVESVGSKIDPEDGLVGVGFGIGNGIGMESGQPVSSSSSFRVVETRYLRFLTAIISLLKTVLSV